MQFSVVIPCYNAERWIGDALRSVQRQTVAPHEIVVVDDGSTDNSVEQIESSGVDVTLIHTKRANGAGARNAGIEVATGDWIAFLDADDVWYEGHLERAAELMDTSSDVAYLSHADSFLDESFGHPNVQHPLPWRLTQPTTGLSHRQFVEMFAGNTWFNTPACVIQRDRLISVGALDVSQVRRHDIDMWLRVIHDCTWTYDTVVTTAYRSNSSGSISRNIANREYYFLRACLKNLERYQGSELESLVSLTSRRAMSAAFTDGDAEDRCRARELAWDHLPVSLKVLFRVMGVCPACFALVNRLRRRWIF